MFMLIYHAQLQQSVATADSSPVALRRSITNNTMPQNQLLHLCDCFGAIKSCRSGALQTQAGNGRRGAKYIQQRGRWQEG